MFSGRPSHRKVVGVARKYLHHEEAAEKSLADLSRFTDSELEVTEAYSLSYLLGLKALGHLMVMPLQARRRRFLEDERDMQGWVPGDDDIDHFALRVAEVSSDSYPYVREALGRLSER